MCCGCSHVPWFWFSRPAKWNPELTKPPKEEESVGETADKVIKRFKEKFGNQSSKERRES